MLDKPLPPFIKEPYVEALSEITNEHIAEMFIGGYHDMYVDSNPEDMVIPGIVTVGMLREVGSFHKCEPIAQQLLDTLKLRVGRYILSRILPPDVIGIASLVHALDLIDTVERTLTTKLSEIDTSQLDEKYGTTYDEAKATELVNKMKELPTLPLNS